MKKLQLIIATALLALLVTGLPAMAETAKTKEYSNSHSLVGKASWYGNQFQGKRTASGERFDKKAYTAAHKTLPFGTIVKVTNTDNNKTVDVKINDRGPFTKERVIDLSQAAFKKIGDTDQGIISIKIEILDDTNTFKYKH